MSAILEGFAQDAGLGPRRRAVVVLEGAGWHGGHEFRVPEGVHLAFLLPYSPELQTAERLWPLINESVSNRTFDNLDELIASVEERCLALDADWDQARRLLRYHWCPEEPTCTV